MASAISPQFQDIDFPSEMSLDQKIEVFADRVTGWQLNIAQKCADIPHSGFAVLSIVFSYFEMIAKYQDGYKGVDKVQEYFKKGFVDVYPTLSNEPQDIREKILEKLYYDVRCGMYHNGITGPDIELSDFDFPVAFVSPSTIRINPHRLAPSLRQHFQSYIRQLRDHRNEGLRHKFEARFNS